MRMRGVKFIGWEGVACEELREACYGVKERRGGRVEPTVKGGEDEGMVDCLLVNRWRKNTHMEKSNLLASLTALPNPLMSFVT